MSIHLKQVYEAETKLSCFWCQADPALLKLTYTPSGLPIWETPQKAWSSKPKAIPALTSTNTFPCHFFGTVFVREDAMQRDNSYQKLSLQVASKDQSREACFTAYWCSYHSEGSYRNLQGSVQRTQIIHWLKLTGKACYRALAVISSPFTREEIMPCLLKTSLDHPPQLNLLLPFLGHRC